MDELFIPMEINLVHVQHTNVMLDMFLKVLNIDIVRVICGGDHRIQYHTVQKKVMPTWNTEKEKDKKQ